jgi:hypothetical protein
MAFRILLLILLTSCSSYQTGTDKEYDYLKAAPGDSVIEATFIHPKNSILYKSKVHFTLTHLASKKEITYYNAQGDFGFKVQPGRYALHKFKYDGDTYITLDPQLIFVVQKNQKLELGKVYLSCLPWTKTSDKDRLKFRKHVLNKKPKQISEFYLDGENDICLFFREGQ